MGRKRRLKDIKSKRGSSQLHKILEMADNPLFTRLSDPLQKYPKNARRVPLNAPHFSKNWQLRPPFLGYF